MDAPQKDAHPMPNNKVESTAFWNAALRSERLRIVGLIVLVSLAALFVTVRTFAWTEPEQARGFGWLLATVGGLLAYESVMLVVVTRAIRAGRLPAAWTWWLNAVAELGFPTLLLLMQTHHFYAGPYWALITPAMPSFFLFIILSTLRLSPLLCFATGAFSGAAYIAVTLLTMWRFPRAGENDGFSLSMYSTYAVLFLLGGVGAAGVARQIKTHVAAALREAEARRKLDRMENDLNIARRIQQGLLPQDQPCVQGFDIAGWSQPADQTGGDYYDWQRLPDGRLAISVADATGHGIGPALVTAVCRAYSRASFPDPQPLGTIMDRVNDLLVDDLSDGRFVTFVVAILNPADASIELASAGHGPLLLYRAAQNDLTTLEAQGIPFGISAGFGFGPPCTVRMDAGDALILITDGFFEWPNASRELFGTDRLQEAIRKRGTLSAKELITGLYHDVLDFAGGTTQLDDLTAVVIRRERVRPA